MDADGKNTIKISGSFTWNGVPSGASTSWSPTLSKNKLITTASGIRSCYPLWGKEYCTGGEEGLGRVVFYGAWESYFLLAEAAVRGWNTAGVSDDKLMETVFVLALNILESVNMLMLILNQLTITVLVLL